MKNLRLRDWDPARPVLLITMFLVIFFITITVLMGTQMTGIRYVNDLGVTGFDFSCFYDAGAMFLQGSDPYQRTVFVTPPLTAVIFSPFSRLPIKLAYGMHLAISLASFLIAYWIVCREMKFPDPRLRRLILVCGLLIAIVSYPVYFLFERGNIDALVMLCLVGGIAFSVSQRHSRDLLAGFCFALAIHLKLYPALVAIPILASRRYKLFGWMMLFSVLLAALTPHLWSSFLTNLRARADGFALNENVSVVNMFFLLLELARIGLGGWLDLSQLAPSLAVLLFYGPLLGAVIYADLRWAGDFRKDNFNILVYFYVPFMLALPQVSYIYGLINLILLVPVVGKLWLDALPSERSALGWIVLGLILSQVQSWALLTVTGNYLPNYLPGFGLMLVMIGAVLYKFRKYDVARRFRALSTLK